MRQYITRRGRRKPKNHVVNVYVPRWWKKWGRWVALGIGIALVLQAAC